MLTPEAATLYLLTVIGVNQGYIETIHQEPRRLLYEECMFLAKREVEFYHFLRNRKVYGKCSPITKL